MLSHNNNNVYNSSQTQANRDNQLYETEQHERTYVYEPDEHENSQPRSNNTHSRSHHQTHMTNPNPNIPEFLPEDEEHEFIEPLPFGVLSRLAHNLYSNPNDVPSYEEKHTVKLPLLAATIDVQASEKAWFLINAFLDLPRPVVHNSNVKSSSRKSMTKKHEKGAAGAAGAAQGSHSHSHYKPGKATSTNASSNSTTSTPDNFKPPKQQIPYLSNDDNISIMNPNPPGHENNASIYNSMLPNQDPLELCQNLCLMGLGNANNDVSLKQIRDEIYCQILKQLNSENDLIVEHGWILLSLVCSTFVPSTKVKYYLKEFIQTETERSIEFSRNASYCEQRLSETETKPRENPPCTIELVAARMVSKCRIPVISMDQSIKTLTCTPALTAQELSEMMADKNLIKDSFGFL